jgi:hypothetical protein
MDKEIKSLIQELEARVGLDCAQKAAAILRAVFDPENQPSQFGTELMAAMRLSNEQVDDANQGRPCAPAQFGATP